MPSFIPIIGGLKLGEADAVGVFPRKNFTVTSVQNGVVTTADTDDRIVPGHSFKFIAKLQYCQAGDAPVLARIETRAGHGAGKPTAKLIEEAADQWAFLVRNLGVKMETH